MIDILQQPLITQSAFSVIDANCVQPFVKCEKSSQKYESLYQ
ncbi:hypothetical protein T11_10457 [Trichinella zimbabwensis]|uniref:Uncharacterized protein n=1 Tax=Trichinella zimbabwensis TaxID=268475 RepID=A0A0V1DMZ7_9BILA|nr:hypothetical protein T11_10457 [Trichinella zimbabwensis]